MHNRSKTLTFMGNSKVAISPDFKKMTSKAVRSIVLFVAVYVALLVSAIGLTVLCGFLGLMLISFGKLITIVLGVGLMATGLFIFFFLIKFIFKRHHVERDNLTEVTEAEQPALFELIREVATEVNTDFPKRVYLSENVNASVFYDSSFWSMFFPIRKNLQIGVGLVNSLTASEFKAVLAHEFGHFSQDSMRVGSYVYNVNQVIYNMLYDNEGYSAWIAWWANISDYFAFFVGLAVRGIQGIQWILMKFYNIINRNNSALSREMEFHADAIAAHVTGSKALQTSLLRLGVADQAYQNVLGFYNQEIENGIKTKNVYPQQTYMLGFLAQVNEINMEHGFPQVTLKHLSQYNQSKLIVKNQWASHPSTADRVAALEKLGIEPISEDNRPASELFADWDKLQEKMTANLFAPVKYEKPTSFISQEEFVAKHQKQVAENSFPKIYNGYYDDKNPVDLDFEILIDRLSDDPEMFDVQDLFSKEKVTLVYQTNALENDIDNLKNIEAGKIDVKTFDYDGTKYQVSDCASLIQQLTKQLRNSQKAIKENDTKIFKHFYTVAQKSNQHEAFTEQYKRFQEERKWEGKQLEAYSKVVSSASFMQETHDYDDISAYLQDLYQVEMFFKGEIRGLLESPNFSPEIDENIKQHFINYVSYDWQYFNGENYEPEAVKSLFGSINYFQAIVPRLHFKLKKEVLDFQASLA